MRSELKLLINSNFNQLNLNNNKKEKKKNVNNNKYIEENNKKEEEPFDFNKNGNKILQRPIAYLSFFLTILLLLLIFLVITIIQVIISKKDCKDLKNISTIRDNIFGVLKYQAQFLIDYEFTILYNEEITVNYKGIVNSYSCDEMKDGNTYRYVFNDLVNCYQKLFETAKQIINRKDSKSLKEFNSLYQKLDTKKFCHYYGKYIIDFIDMDITPKLTYLEENSYDILYNECYNIGNGLNTEGLNTAFSTCHDSIISYYINKLN